MRKYIVGMLLIVNSTMNFAAEEVIQNDNKAVERTHQAIDALFADDKDTTNKDLAVLGQAAMQGDIAAQINLGNFYYKHEDYDQGLSWYRTAAEQGSAEAQTILGNLYNNTQNSDQDAMDWFRKAAKQGYAPAQYRLGSMYEQMDAIQPSQNAIDWYREAAVQGNIEAQERLNQLDQYPALLEKGLWQDPKTNLIWSRCSLGQTWTGSTCEGDATQFTWTKAVAAVKNVGYAGVSGWRLPTQEELTTRQMFGKLNERNALFWPSPNESGYFWSSTLVPKNNRNGWVNYVFGANQYGYYGFDKKEGNYVRLVRSNW